MDKIRCKYCKEEFVPYHKTQICCGKKECKLAKDRESWLNRGIKSVCKDCGKEYIAHENNIDYCNDCFRKHKNTYNFKSTYYKVHVCRQCKDEVFRETKNRTNTVNLNENDELIISDCTCDKCKKINLENSSIRMKLNNANPYCESKANLEEWYNWNEQKLKDKQEKIEHMQENILAFKQRTSERMKLHNPMFNSETVKKVSATINAKIQSEEIIIKKGAERYNWKGGSDNPINYLRSCLKDWRKNALKKANYTCQCCGQYGVILNVHHLEPFREIVQKALIELQIDKNTLKVRDENFNRLEKWLYDYHMNNDIALVVCENCHDKIDKNFHKQKNIKYVDYEKFN